MGNGRRLDGARTFRPDPERAIVSRVKLVRVAAVALLVVLAFGLFNAFRRSAAPRRTEPLPRTCRRPFGFGPSRTRTRRTTIEAYLQHFARSSKRPTRRSTRPSGASS